MSMTLDRDTPPMFCGECGRPLVESTTTRSRGYDPMDVGNIDLWRECSTGATYHDVWSLQGGLLESDGSIRGGVWVKP